MSNHLVFFNEKRIITTSGTVFVLKGPAHSVFKIFKFKVVADHFMKNTMSKVKGSFLGPFSFGAW